jgi:hypothetical protein
VCGDDGAHGFAFARGQPNGRISERLALPADVSVGVVKRERGRLDQRVFDCARGVDHREPVGRAAATIPARGPSAPLARWGEYRASAGRATRIAPLDPGRPVCRRWVGVYGAGAANGAAIGVGESGRCTHSLIVSV